MENLNLLTFKEKIFDFEKDSDWVFKGTKPAIVDFYADWCGPCKMLAPVLAEISKEYEGIIDVYKIDTEKEQELSSVFGISSIPSILFIPLKEKPQMLSGALPRDGLKEVIARLFNL